MTSIVGMTGDFRRIKLLATPTAQCELSLARSS
jgi:hypothetical protein